ncbi:MAG TPA: serine hydrolase domain-containing protein [Fimbriimonadaceae bacterium]|nr:serine hydrolase domain-containing protein [Fimbriimonadaceae bacterium]
MNRNTIEDRHELNSSVLDFVQNESVVTAQRPRPSAPWTYPHIDAARVEGKCSTRFEPVWKLLENLIDSGDDVGASIAVFIDGEPQVDIWGGFFDSGFVRPWERDTIITTHSVTKTMTAIAALVLADQGELDLDARVAHYWPEFGVNGKQNILVRNILGHTSGVAGWDEDVTWEDVFDLERSTDMLARQAPWWEPGTASGYHGMNQGHLVHGIIRRITGMTLGQFFAKHVATPLGADYHIGTGPECDHRISSFIPATYRRMPVGNPIAERVGLNPLLTPQTSMSTAWRRAEVGAANGHGNARSVATVFSALASGGANGMQLLSEKGRHRALEEQSNGVDLLLGVPCRWGMGFGLEGFVFPNPQGHRIATWGGIGGSLAYADFDERMSVGYVMNRWLDGPYETARFNRILNTIHECLRA